MEGKELGTDGPTQTSPAMVLLYHDGLRNPSVSEDPDCITVIVCNKNNTVIIKSVALQQCKHKFLNICILFSVQSLVTIT